MWRDNAAPPAQFRPGPVHAGHGDALVQQRCFAAFAPDTPRASPAGMKQDNPPAIAAAPSEAQRAACGAAPGIDEAMIRTLVDAFYDRVRADEELAPIFAAKIADWPVHLQQMYAFWSSVTLASGRYRGRPMPKHARLPVSGRHFDRWLALFEATAREVCPPQAAAHFIDRARRIAQSLERGVAMTRGADLAPGERLGEP